MSFPYDKFKRKAEANIQAHFYMACTLKGIPCQLEYRHGRCQFDAIIHDSENILAIVEVKNHSERYRQRPQKPTKQLAKYNAHGVPVFLIRCWDDVMPTVGKIISQFYPDKYYDEEAA